MKTNNLQENYFGLTFIATGKETNGNYFLSKTTVAAGDSGPPMHVHTKEDEGFYLESGELTFMVDRQEIKLKTGEFLNIEKGEAHTWKNESHSDAKLIVTFSPAGIENMFKELEHNMKNIKQIGQKYGTDFQIDSQKLS